MKTLNVDVLCKRCNTNFRLVVDKKGYSEWKNGTGFIQDLLPKSSAADRELLLSKTCDSCWHELFGENNDEEQ